MVLNLEPFGSLRDARQGLNISDCHNWEEGAAGIQWGEARAGPPCPTVQEDSPTMANDPAQNIRRTEAEKEILSSRMRHAWPLKNPHCLPRRKHTTAQHLFRIFTQYLHDNLSGRVKQDIITY